MEASRCKRPAPPLLPPLPWWERGPSVAGSFAGMTANRSCGRFQIAEPGRLGLLPVHVVGRVVPFPEGAFFGLALEDGNGFTLSAHNGCGPSGSCLGQRSCGSTRFPSALYTSMQAGPRFSPPLPGPLPRGERGEDRHPYRVSAFRSSAFCLLPSWGVEPAPDLILGERMSF